MYISQAYDKVLYTGLIHLRKGYGISGGIIFSLLSNREMKVIMKGHASRSFALRQVSTHLSLDQRLSYFHQ